MTIVIVDEPEDSNDGAVEQLAETVEELAETVEELATESEPVVVVEPEDSSLSDIVLGTVVERLNRLEEQVANISITADVALSVAETAIDESVVEVEPEVETEPEPDVPPATWKTKFHKFWFGDAV